MRVIRRFLNCDSGATAIEYCLIAGLISIAVLIGATAIGSKLNSRFYGPVAAGLN